jgi:hypothetical protein
MRGPTPRSAAKPFRGRFPFRRQTAFCAAALSACLGLSACAARGEGPPAAPDDDPFSGERIKIERYLLQKYGLAPDNAPPSAAPPPPPPIPSAAADLGVTTGLVLWIRADRGAVTNAAGVVLGWLDWSTNEYHIGRLPGGPAFVPQGIGGRPAIRFDGADDFARAERGGDRLAGDFTAAIVFNPLDPAQHAAVASWGGLSNGARRCVHWAAPAAALGFNGLASDGIPPPPGGGLLAVVVREAAGDLVRLYLNGRPAGTGREPLRAGDSAAITFAADSAGGRRLRGDIAEVALFDRALPDGELARLQRHLAQRYGLDGTPR